MQRVGLQPSQHWRHLVPVPCPRLAGVCLFALAAPATCPLSEQVPAQAANTACSACTLPTPQGHGSLLGDPPREKPPLRFPPLRLQSQQKPFIFPTVGFAACGHRAGGTWELLSSLQHHCWCNKVQVK